MLDLLVAMTGMLAAGEDSAPETWMAETKKAAEARLFRDALEARAGIEPA
jgi:hypothetical protein